VGDPHEDNLATVGSVEILFVRHLSV